MSVLVLIVRILLGRYLRQTWIMTFRRDSWQGFLIQISALSYQQVNSSFGKTNLVIRIIDFKHFVIN